MLLGLQLFFTFKNKVVSERVMEKRMLPSCFQYCAAPSHLNYSSTEHSSSNCIMVDRLLLVLGHNFLGIVLQVLRDLCKKQKVIRGDHRMSRSSDKNL